MKAYFFIVLYLLLLSLGFGQKSKDQKVIEMEIRLQKLEETLAGLRNQNSNRVRPVTPVKPLPIKDSTRGKNQDFNLPQISSKSRQKAKKNVVPELKSSKRIDNGQRLSLIKSDFPLVEEILGQVTRYQNETKSFLPILPGYEITQPTLFVVGDESELIMSFPGRIATRVSANSRVVVGPLVEGRYEVDLRHGTLSALLDPERDLSNDPSFAVRTLSGVTEAVGTYFAVTEYTGQSYTAVNKGKVKKKTTPPTEPDFSTYLKKKKPTASKTK